MASACVNNVGLSPDNFLECSPATYPSYGWLGPRISFSREFPSDESSKIPLQKLKTSLHAEKQQEVQGEESDPEVFGNDVGDFEFRLEDPVKMLPADELFSDGKLVPLQLSMIPPSMTSTTASVEMGSPDAPKTRRRSETSSMDPYLFSPKAPRCSSRWKEILGLKKLYLNSNAKQDNHKSVSSVNTGKSLKHFLHRSSKSSKSALDSSLSLPLLKDADNESITISSRLSLSSSSSGHDHDDLPRHSIDSEKPSLNHNPLSLTRNSNTNSNPPRVRVRKPRALSSENPVGTGVGRSPLRRAPDPTTTTGRGVSVDSPRMNSSGKIIFHSLERSSSSPSSFNSGPRFKHRGMERSYSANVRVTPVLNVPVCSLRGSSKSGVFGFPLFSSPQKREAGGSSVGNGGGNKGQQSSSKNRMDRF
ncbi:unnamed protein product [Ilex paraguariensis]|uniref:Uncharacterized protein n=1 Tax=Ilex paraguariensis TaxID=185542 RepID=A0ABC8TZW1_9AQUA